MTQTKVTKRRITNKEIVRQLRLWYKELGEVNLKTNWKNTGIKYTLDEILECTYD